MIEYIIQVKLKFTRQKFRFLDIMSKSVQKENKLMVDRKEKTRQAILRAMVTLLKTESFDDITTIKLAKRAGISRSSFYTHYKDKYEMIDYYQQTFFHKLEYIFEKEYQNKELAFLEVFEFLQREQLLSSLLSANGTKEIQTFIINKVRLLINIDLQGKFNTEELSQTEKEYRSIYLAHAFFGVCQSWIAKGKTESPQEMTRFVLKMLSNS